MAEQSNSAFSDLPSGAQVLSVPQQGQSTPGLLQPGNIDLYNRPHVTNSDGSISTVRSMSFGENGKEILVPTVSEDGRIMSDREAIDTYHQTGKHLGVFDSPSKATAYAVKLHNDYAAGKYDQTSKKFSDLPAGAQVVSAPAQVTPAGALQPSDDQWFHGSQSPEAVAAARAANPPMQQLKEAAIGAAKSAGQTGSLILDYLSGGPSAVAIHAAGVESPNRERLDNALTPKNDDQKAGAMVEQLGEFMLGDLGAAKGIAATAKLGMVQDALKLAEKYPAVAKLLHAGMTFLRQGSTATGVGLAHGEEPSAAAKQGAAVGALGGVLEGAASFAPEVKASLQKGKQLIRPSAEVQAQITRDSIKQVLGTKADADVLDEAADRIGKTKLFSTVENELKLVKPQLDTELKTMTSQLDDLLTKSPAQVPDAAHEVNKVMDQMIANAKAGVGDSEEAQRAVNTVRSRVVSKLGDQFPQDFSQPIAAKDLNQVKHLVGDEIKKFAPPENLTSAQKWEQEAYRQVYFRLRDMVSEAVPASKELNGKISKGIQLQDLLEKKFPHLETPQAAQASYSGTRATNLGKTAVKVGKAIAVPAGLGTAYELGKNVTQ